MNVIDEFNELMAEPPALSQHIRDRAKETLMHQLTTFEIAQAAPRRPRRLRRRVFAVGIVAVAAAAALVFGVALPTHSPLSAPPASAAVVALRTAADKERALPDTPPDLTGVAPEIVALLPLMKTFPTAGTTAEVWAWVDANCAAGRPRLDGTAVGITTPGQRADESTFLDGQDCGLIAVFAFLQVSTPAQRAALLDAIASLPTLTTVDGQCQPGGAVLHGPSQEFRVSRNGTDIVLTVTHSPTGKLEMSMTMWIKTVAPPCPQLTPKS